MKQLFAFSQNTLPKQFRGLCCPHYASVASGDWRIFRAPDTSGLVQAYFSNGANMPREYWVLMHGDKVWMSMTPLELQSQSHHAWFAHGHVVVMGLGMGAVLYNLLQNPKVVSITVVEREQTLVELLRHSAPWFDACVNAGKIIISISDAFRFIPPKDTVIDTLIVDLWTAMGQERTQSDVLKIQDNVRAIRVGWWGQELSIVSWIYQHHDERSRFPFSREHIVEYESANGLKVMGASHSSYPSLMLAASINASAGTMQQLQSKSAQITDNALGSAAIVTAKPNVPVDPKAQEIGGLGFAGLFKGFFNR
jgi:hypothetical protein